MQNSSPLARLYDGSGGTASQKSNDNFLKLAQRCEWRCRKPGAALSAGVPTPYSTNCSSASVVLAAGSSSGKNSAGPVLSAAGRCNRRNQGAGQSRDHGRPGYRIMPRAGLDEKEIGAARYRAEVALGLARKQRFGRDELMPACRKIGIGVGPDDHLADRTAVQLHVTCANGHGQAVAFFLKHHDAGLSRFRRTNLLRDRRIVGSDFGGHTARQKQQRA